MLLEVGFMITARKEIAKKGNIPSESTTTGSFNKGASSFSYPKPEDYSKAVVVSVLNPNCFLFFFLKSREMFKTL